MKNNTINIICIILVIILILIIIRATTNNGKLWGNEENFKTCSTQVKNNEGKTTTISYTCPPSTEKVKVIRVN